MHCAHFSFDLLGPHKGFLNLTECAHVHEFRRAVGQSLGAGEGYDGIDSEEEELTGEQTEEVHLSVSVGGGFGPTGLK